MSDEDLVYLPAHQAIARFKSRELSPVELMEATIRRAEAVKEPYRALTYTHFDEAMDAARKAEARYAKGGRTRALEGLPVGIKDENDIKGRPTSSGSLILRAYVASRTSVGNDRVFRAGGIAHARTATPEFSCSGVTWSRLWGVTRNPWNPDFTTGGSSGGAGASLALGTSAIASGSDIGGSIRIPASACGVVGYKPPYGRNSDDPPFNLDFFCHTGPLGRNVRDTILLQNVMSGPSPRDISTLRPKLRLPMEYRPIKGWKIAWSMDFGFAEVDEEVRKNTLAALEVFRSLGATVEEVDLRWTKKMFGAGLTYLYHIFGAYLSRLLPDHADEMTTYARRFAEKGAKSKATDLIDSLDLINQMYETLGPVLERHDVLICPTLAVPAVAADHDSTKDTVRINGKTVDPELGWVMTLPFNMLSRCPVLSMPSGRASNGVPTGMQIVGRTYSDASVFQAAMAYETATGAWYEDPTRRPKV